MSQTDAEYKAEQRKQAGRTAKDVIVNRLNELGGQMNWRCESLTTHGNNSASVTLQATGWPGFRVSVVVDIDVMVKDEK